MKHSKLLFLLILALLLGGSYSLAGARVDEFDNKNSDAPAGERGSERSGGDSGFLTGPNAGEPLDIALEYLEKNKNALGLTSDDVADVVVTDQYTSQHNGVTHIYLRQRYQGIEVFSADLNVNIAADGSVINMSHRFISDLAKAVNTSRASLSATQAVESAAQELGLELRESLRVVEQTRGPANETLLSDGGISLNDIPIKLMYQPSGSRGPKEPLEVRLAWNVVIYEKDAQHWWDMRVDALTSKLLDQKDLVISENWGHSEQDEHNQPDATSASPPLTRVSEYPPNTPRAGGRRRGTLLATCTATGGSDEYCVYGMPAETPNHGDRSMESNPADSTASPHGWHDTDGAAGAESNHTVGNNVDAYQDTDNSNGPTGSDAARADGGDNRVFNFDVDLTQEPSTYQDAAISNLFYWNNVIHDVFYQYGFDEASGNFQENNYGNAGAGSDGVNAEAQDGGGLNNANFATPPDGGNPRMQMYLWNLTSPQRDGDFDNGIIMHEYGHGISIRLTGGPSNSSCLFNSEQGGEGWSDWFGLMLTMKAGDMGADKRGIGTYVLGQPTDGNGIRPAPYSTDIAINNYTYGRIDSQAIPHGVGFVWATMLWEMNWALIDQHGFDPDIYNGNGGNNIAMQLVVDGLKLQPCSPGFVDARDAILQADQMNNNGANQCLIWDAFAKRGLGYSAQQGSSESTTDGSEAFDIPAACETLAVIPETQNICVGDTAAYTVSVGQAFTPPVTMSASGQPAGSSATFDPNPVTTAPTTTTLTIGNTAGVATGHYTIMITGTDTISTSHLMADLNVFDGNPATVSLSQPSDGATGVSRTPTFEWNAASGAQSYDIEVASDSGFSNIVYSASSESTSHTATSSLSPLTTYYWRVRAVNPCGNGDHSGVFSFSTEEIPPILLVDDDDNSPDVRSYYTQTLEALGQSYDVWDTENSDNEPDASYLAPYNMVIWFTGDEFGGAAGPGSEGETALSSYLDSGKCLFISSEDYYYDRGLTTFMKDYLGVASASSDVGQTTVTGDGTVFSGLGPYSLSYPVSNYSDVISPDGSAELAFSGDEGDAAVNKDSGVYRTTFFGYPFEALPSATEQQSVMQSVIDWCGTGVATGTLTGTIVDTDTNAGISEAIITTDDGNMQRTTRTDANGDYSLIVAVGTYDVTASATNYVSDTVSTVVITTDTVTVRDFVLQGSSLSYSPAQIEHSMEIGDVVSTTVTVQNSGPLPIDFNVRIGDYDGPSVQLQQSSISIPASVGDFPRGSAAPSIGRPPTDYQSEVASQNRYDLGRLNLNGGVEAYGVDLFVPELLSFTTDDPANTTSIATVSGSLYAGDFLNGDFSRLYALDNGDAMLYAIDTATGDMTAIGPSIPSGYQSWSGMAGDPTTGMMYASSTDCSNNTIYTIDTATGTPTVIASTTGVCIIDLAINAAGQMYGVDIIDDNLLSIDKATGAITVIGSIGFDANFAQDLDFDEETNILYLAAFNNSAFQPQLRIADTSTGNSALVGAIAGGQVDSFAIATGGSSNSWASAEPNSGTVPPNSSATFEVVFDARTQSELGEHTAKLNFSGSFVNDVPTMPLTMQLGCPTCGVLDGQIRDLETGAPVNAQLHVTSTNGLDVYLNRESYEIAVQPGTYNVTASANGYFDQSATVVATQATTVTTDLALTPMIAKLEYTPAEISESMQVGEVISNTVTVTNPGYVDLEFNVRIGDYNGPGVQLHTTSISIPASDGNFPRGSQAPSIGRPPADYQGEVASQDGHDLGGLNLNGGVEAYGVDLFVPDFLSFTTDDPANTTSIATVSGSFYAGDFLDGDFSTLYALDNSNAKLIAIDTATGDITTIGPSVASGGQSWSGMAGDPKSGIMYASSTDCSDNTIYTIDIATGTPTVVGSPSGVCIIDIAINAAGEIYGVDIIEDELLSIDNATGAVTVIGSIGFDANYAQDMDFDEEANILYLAAFNLATFNAELRIADTTTGNTTLVGAIDAGQVDAFGIATGGSSGSRWASAVPNSGTVPPNSSATFEVVFDARAVTEHGEHTANLNFSGNFVNDVPTMPLTMQLGCPTCGLLNGAITDNLTGDPVTADINVSGPDNFEVMVTGDDYHLTLPAGSYDLNVQANGYFSQTTSLNVTQATTTTTDFALVPMIALLEYDPDALDVAVQLGSRITRSLTLSNVGTIGLSFNIDERGGASRAMSGVPWLSEDPTSGTLAAGASMDIDVGFDSSTLSELGTYTAELLINGTFDHSPATIPVTMTVQPAAPVLISDVRTTNLRDISFTVSWLSDAASRGHIRYGSDPNNLSQTGQDVRGAVTSDETHYVLVQNLSPNSTYYFDVVSGSTTDDNGGAHYTVTTGTTLGVPGTDTVYGNVFKADGTTPADGTIVYITVKDNDDSGSTGQSALLSALVESGAWNTNLGNARTEDVSAYFSYSASGDQLFLEAEGGADGTAAQSVDTADDKPAPPMLLTATPTPTPTPTSSVTPTPNGSVTPTPTGSITPSATASVEPSATASVEPTPTASVEPSATASVEPSATASVEPSATASVEPSATASVEPTPTASVEPSATASVEPSATASVEPSATASVEPSATASVEPSATASVEPSATASVEPSATASVEPSATASVEPSATASVTPSATATVEPSATASVEPSATASVEPSATASVEPSATASVEPTPTATVEPGATATVEPTPTASVEPTPTATVEPSATASVEPSATASVTPSATASVTPSATATVTPSATASVTPSATASVTPTATASVTPTATSSVTPPPTGSVTPSATASVEPSATASVEPSATATVTPTPTSVAVAGVEISRDMAISETVGRTVSYTLQVTNTGNVSDTFDLAVSGETWTTNVSPDSVTVNADASTTVTVSVQIPANAADGESDTATLAAISQADSTVSDEVQLTTTGLINDGVPGDVENGAPNNGDGNNDGTPDSSQEHVTSLTSAGDNQGYVTLESPPDTLLVNVEARPASEIPTMPTDTVYLEMGVFDFMINDVEVGGSVVMTLTLHHTDTGANSYWKYGPEPDNTTDHWYEFNFDSATGTGAVINGNTITLHFVDGQRGDHDLSANGQIIDPGAPAMRQAPLNISLANFDAQAALPSRQAGVVLLVTLTATLGLFVLRKRQKGTSTTT